MKKILFLLTLLMTMLYGHAATEVTFDFTGNEWEHPLGSGSGAEADAGNLDELTKDDVLAVFKQSSASTHPRYWTGPQVRLYNKNILRLVAPEGKAIIKVEYTATGTNYFGLTAASGTLTETTWTGNAAYAKFTATKSNRLSKMVVTLDDANADTDKAADADETVFLDFNDPTIHDEFNVSSNTYLTEDIVLTDGHRDSDDKIDGENTVTTTIPFIPDVANSQQNYIRIASLNVSMYLRGGKVTFKTHADKIIKNIKMTAAAFNATLNGEEVTKDQITGDGWEGNSNVVEMEVTGGTNITNITFVIADKPMEEVVEPGLTEFYIMGNGTENGWDNTTSMTLNEETDAFEYELTLTSTSYITFGDAAFTDWDDFNANHRYGIGVGNVDATLDTPTKLDKYSDGCLVITEAGKYKVTVTKDLEVTITKTGDVTAEISKVQICGATDPEWSNRIDFDLTKGEGEEEVYTGVLDPASTNDVEFKLVVNEGNWLGFNELTLDAPDGWVVAQGDDKSNFVLKNANTGYTTYTVTATWVPNANAASNWTLKIEGKDKSAVEPTVEKITVTPEDGADIYEAYAAEAKKVTDAGNTVGDIEIVLAENGNYTISNTITANASLAIYGNGATVDASGLSGNMVELAVLEDPTEWKEIGGVGFVDLTVKGLKKSLFYSAGKNYVMEELGIVNCVIEQAGDATTIDFTKGSTAMYVGALNSTIYAPTATTKSFYSSQSGQKATEYKEDATQNFIFKNNTMYNLAPEKNFFTHRQSNQKWLSYDVENNIFVNCGKSGQVIRGMNGGQGGSNPTWTITGNLFNFNGEDTSAAESTGDDNEPVSDSVEGIITFTDPTAPDFSGTVLLDPSASKPSALGDPRWTLTYADALAINITESEGGTVTASSSTAAEGTTITLTVTPAEDYEQESLTVKDASDAEVTVADDNTFTMPASAVTVTATFSLKTGITNVNANDNLGNDAPAYNLAGQRMNANTTKGIFIKNGRKYVK